MHLVSCGTRYRRFIRELGGWASLQILLEAANTVAQKHGVSIANVACRHVIENDAVAGVIVGLRPGKSAHFDENQKMFSFELDEEDKAALKAAQQAVALKGAIRGDCGDECVT